MSKTASRRDRPLSPHLSIYRWPITMTLSILHRATGIAMSIGFVVLVAWLLSAADGTATYAKFADLMGGLIGKLLMVGWSFAFFFHMANGIRHLVWDAGHGFEIQQANRSAWFVLLTSIVLTALFWWCIS